MGPGGAYMKHSTICYPRTPVINRRIIHTLYKDLPHIKDLITYVAKVVSILVKTRLHDATSIVL